MILKRKRDTIVDAVEGAISNCPSISGFLVLVAVKKYGRMSQKQYLAVYCPDTVDTVGPDAPCTYHHWLECYACQIFWQKDKVKLVIIRPAANLL